MLINGLIVGAPLFSGNDALIYTVYIIIFWTCVNTNRRKIDGRFLVTAMWWITGVYSCLLFYVLTDHFRNLAGIGFTYLPGGADRLTLSVIGFMHLCAFLVYEARSLPEKGLKYLFAIIAFYDLSICSRRGLLVALIFIIIYQIYVRYGEKFTQKKLLSALISIVGILLIITTIFLMKPEIFSGIERYGRRLINGINAYLGSFSKGIDPAAEARNLVMKSVPQEYLSADIITILFGNGYGYRQLDLPYLQAFTDLGLIWGIYYFVIQCLYPIRILMKREKDCGVSLLKYIGIMTVTYNLYSGVPYGHYKFVGLILMIYAADRKKTDSIRLPQRIVINDTLISS